MSENFDEIMKALGKEQAKRGRKKGETDPHTKEQDAKVVALSKKARKVGNAHVFTLPDGSIVTKEGKNAGYDQRRAYAKRFCEANAGWVIAPKTTDGTVVLVKR